MLQRVFIQKVKKSYPFCQEVFLIYFIKIGLRNKGLERTGSFMIKSCLLILTFSLFLTEFFMVLLLMKLSGERPSFVY